MNTPTILRVVVTAAALLASFTIAPAQVPQLISYQGRVAVGGVNFDGSGQFKFALVNAAGTTTYWSNNGSSTAGSQPTAAVTLAVTKGLYSVQLGDTTLSNMTAVPASVFTNSDVRLRVWFNDGTNGFQLLTPDQRIVAVGYAMMAENVKDGSITAAKIASGAVGSSQLAVGAADNSFSVAQLQAMSGPLPFNQFAIKDLGREGVFQYDATDTTTAHDGALTVVTSDGKRLKRVWDEAINLRWFGAKGDGVTDDTAAIQAAFAKQRKVFVPKGTYVVNGSSEILNNVECEKDAIFLVKAGYSGTIFTISSNKGLILKNIYIDAQTSGSCTGLLIEGLWNSIIENYSFLAAESDVTSIGIDILTSEPSLGWGAYVISIHNPYLLRGASGIRTRQTPGDTNVDVTHLNIYGGWVSSHKTAGFDFTHLTNFSIFDTAFDVIQSIGIKLNNSHQGHIFMGEYNSGVFLNVAADCSQIRLHATRPVDFTTAVVGNSYSASTANVTRLIPTYVPNYYTELRSNYVDSRPFEIVGKFGSSAEEQILRYDLTNGLVPKLFNPAAAGSSLVGVNAGGGMVKALGDKKMTNASAAPVSGTWAVGDLVFNSAPAPGGSIGWVCTTAGTPGTWKPFGAIGN